MRQVGTWIEDLSQDVRVGWRGLVRRPGFALTATLTLALGIGGNTAIFSVLNAVILRPLPYPEPDRLVQIVERNPDPGWGPAAAVYTDMAVEAHNYRDYREQNSVFEEMGWVSSGPYSILGGEDQPAPTFVKSVSVSPSVFSVLGIRPALGTVWTEEDGRFAYRTRVAVLGHDVWQDRFGSDPDVVDRTITLDGWPHRVVGVLPPGAELPPLSVRDQASHEYGDTDVYVPLGFDAYGPGLPRRIRAFRVIARLRPGVSPEQAQAEMTALAAGLEEAYPENLEGWTAGVIPLRAVLTRFVGPRIALLMGAVAIVLLIACANAANLLLAHGTTRRREMAVRAGARTHASRKRRSARAELRARLGR